MVSVIICSREADISQLLKDNIAATIGCEYELCVIDNSRNEYNIFSAYNEGIRCAKGNILCFMHDDVVFYSDIWGRILEEHFAQYPKVGAIGVAGGHYLPKRPCYWNEPRKESAHYIQGSWQNGTYKSHSVNHQHYRSARTLVAALDGVLIAMPKNMFTVHKLRWDDLTFHGFHFYDADICMQVHKAGYEVEVLWNILMEHKSNGSFTEAFIRNRKIWFEKWKESLPLVCGIEMDQEDMEICENIMDITDDSHAYYLIQQSKAYRLGKRLLKPLEWLRK